MRYFIDVSHILLCVLQVKKSFRAHMSSLFTSVTRTQLINAQTRHTNTKQPMFNFLICIGILKFLLVFCMMYMFLHQFIIPFAAVLFDAYTSVADHPCYIRVARNYDKLAI